MAAHREPEAFARSLHSEYHEVSEVLPALRKAGNAIRVLTHERDYDRRALASTPIERTASSDGALINGFIPRGPHIGADVHGRCTIMWEHGLRVPTTIHVCGWGNTSTTVYTEDSDDLGRRLCKAASPHPSKSLGLSPGSATTLFSRMLARSVATMSCYLEEGRVGQNRDTLLRPSSHQAVSSAHYMDSAWYAFGHGVLHLRVERGFARSCKEERET